jgi:hypothetical protein
MELIFQEQTIKMDKTPTAQELIKKINALLEKGYYFSHFIVDGIEVYEEHERYLNNNEGQIKRLVIVAKTVMEFVNDLLLSTEEYIERAIPELTVLYDEFYDNPKSETWERLDQLLGGLQWLDEMLLLIGKSGAVPSNWVAYMTLSATMQKEIRNLSIAIENNDYILIGDIIQYELVPNFESLNTEVKQTIDNEGMRYDLS